ncbi:hypothetical protein CAPTEDRAFT_202313 [Capitella teleta]|uniref:SOCS box domain-containing protein n=1 Tax=Capitella teleta TaxID=283909 RepID=R7UY50_CAPTE|nr:hypothetical protein CAPTEDRAFT_202313 [Capitella teleta]|eukprot:ELU11172.1 hypothetical protein CAPTEDRAFT_202313 [Capitella teleta]
MEQAQANAQVSCIKDFSFSLTGRPDDPILRASIGQTDITIPVCGVTGLVEKLREGCHLHERTLLYRQGLAFLLLHTSAKKTPDTHHVICVDVERRRALGMMAVSELQPSGSVESVEVFSADFSPNREFLAVAVGVVTGRSYMYMSETGSCFVVLYDVAPWTKRMRIQTGSFVTPSVAFDPSALSDAPRMTVVHSDSYEKPMLTTYNVVSGEVQQRSDFIGVELDGDTTTQVVYTRDGHLLLLLALEDMWHDKTSLCRVFALKASTLTLFHRYPASVVRPCHPDCVFTVRPELQACGTRFVVQGTRVEHRYEEQMYNVPCPLGLRAMCRMALLRHLPNGPRSALDLPLPKKLQQYVAFKS